MARSIRPFTAPEAATLRARAQEAQRAARARGAHYRRNFLDTSLWNDLWAAVPHNKNVRLPRKLPQWHVPPTPGQMARWLRLLGRDTSAYLEWSGEPNLRAFAAHNPDFPLRAWVGLVLEWIASEDGPAPVPGATRCDCPAPGAAVRA